MRSGIVAAGTAILDIVHIVDRWPPEEQMGRILGSQLGAGGPPYNAASALKRLGAPWPVQLRAVVGADPHGAEFLRQVEAVGLDTSAITQLQGAVTSHTHVMTSQATGKRTFFHNVGANAELAPAHLVPADDAARILYLGSPGIAPGMDENGGWLHVLRQAKHDGFTTALELVPVSTGGLAARVRPLLPYTDIFVVNDSEAEEVSGISVTRSGRLEKESATRACAGLMNLGVKQLVAIHHPDGAVGMDRTGQASAGSVRVPPTEIVGSVGAGDSFFAGVLFGFHEGWPLAKCLALGNAAAATSLHSATTTASVRRWDECLAYAALHGTRTLA